ncbi:hypothetical protein [Paraburkholderia antibiotica]|uniref:Uncharacterized protein n=1 Tax=Paraburkholderia antibiotica TaxID=2728839 RepID=A0A7Y0A135_9BURK|nr:hypothetical protein [Paraburkholderia antibiotica]NML34537.1 hypothetical protein [Paraburkholderia antibiotica]
MPDNDDEVLFARSGMSHPLGKLVSMMKTVVPEVVEDRMIAAARAEGMSMAELHREILCRWACGDEIDRLVERRRRVALMNGSNSGPERGSQS